MMRMTAPLIAIALSLPSAALAQQDNMMTPPTADYPPCSAKVTDHCTETPRGMIAIKKAKVKALSDMTTTGDRVNGDRSMSDPQHPDPK